MFPVLLSAALGAPSLFDSAFGNTEAIKPFERNDCYPEIARFDPADPNLSEAARKSLLEGTLLANDKSKGSGWLIQMGVKKTLRYDLPFAGGNHESGVSPDGRHFAIPHYETGTYNSTEGGGDPGSSISLVEVDTGRTAVLPMKPNPWVNDANGLPASPSIFPKPHDANFLPNGDVLATSQVADSVIRVDAKTGNVTAYALHAAGCSTPHLVRAIPSYRMGGKPRFAVTGCRGTNADTPSDYVGRLAIIDLKTGENRALKTPGAKWNEGITVTSTGDVWVGSLNSHFVTVFGWKAPPLLRTLDNFEQLEKIPVRFPLRFAYEEVTDRVAVATIDLNGVLHGDTKDSGLHIFDARTRTLLKSMVLRTDRGVINSEGLRNGPGFFWTGGFDTQAGVIVDSESLEQVAEILMPRCSMPAGMCEPVKYMPNNAYGNADIARRQGLTGWNNWSGGLCQATERTPFDQRFTVLDGFNYSPVFPKWAWF